MYHEFNDSRFSNSQFKTILIKNKYATYQRLLEESISNPYYKKYWVHLSDEQRSTYDCRHKYYYCCDYHCCNSSGQYFKMDINKINYDNINNFKFNKNIDKINIKESLWFNCKNQSSFIIGGNYESFVNGLARLYIPRSAEHLTLNGIPVKYINERYKNPHGYQCALLHFSFDLSLYCKSITYILKSYKRRHLLFRFLPLEILRYILYLTSLY